jgi:hypothetical protein
MTGHRRLRSDSHEARSTMRLDPWKNLQLAQSWVDPVDPVEPADTSSPTYLQTKVKVFNATANHFLPTWLQHRQYRSGTSVKSRFLPPIPGWAVKTCHCTHHVGYCSAIDAPSRHKTRPSHPGFLGPGLIHSRRPPSDTPRPGLD